jgi:glycosyltransferase involved in cell wall biosynthesis
MSKLSAVENLAEPWPDLAGLKVAIVHDWLTQRGGAEGVLAELLNVVPQAELHCVVDFLPEADRGFLGGRPVKTTFVQNLPFAKKRYRSYLPLMPLAIEQFDLKAYDLVLSSSYAVAKGVITDPNQVHVSYVHSPMRYAWDMQHRYLLEAGITKGLRSVIARSILHYMRIWDTRTVNGVDSFLANSAFIAGRVRKTYGRRAQVIHPPVDTETYKPNDGQRGDFYLTASRMVPYKCIPMIVEAFRATPERKLVVIGEGPDFDRAKRAGGPNVEFLGYQSRAVLLDHMQRAKAFVFAAEEDFGIVPLEAQACGTPVIAFGRAGSLETVRGRPGPNRTGVYFDEQTPEAISAAVDEFERVGASITAEACRKHAEGFSAARFRNQIAEAIRQALTESQVANRD